MGRSDGWWSMDKGTWLYSHLLGPPVKICLGQKSPGIETKSIAMWKIISDKIRA